MTSRAFARPFFASLGMTAIALAMVSGPAFAQRAEKGPAEVPVEELLKPGAQPDIVLGSPEAKITIVEYASMTCGHCANFATKTFPDLKTKYIDTGKIRFISREFPLDNLAVAASMLTRCVAPDKAYPLVETLFATQATWAGSGGNPVPKLYEIAKQAGFTQDSFDKCLRDDKLVEDITASRTRGSEKFGVSATPTFFINGKRLTTGNQIADFDKVLEPLLAEK